MTNTREAEESVQDKLWNLDDIFTDIRGYSPDGEIGTLVNQGMLILAELDKSHHQELQKARKKERERIASELDGLMEKLADIEHVRWAKWQNYLHSHLTWNNEIQAWVLQHEWKDRWQMQINKPYSMLSEKEKESDREQVRPYLELIKRKVRYQSELDQPTV